VTPVRPRLSVIGPGKVGTALATLARDAGYRVHAVAGRNEARSRAAAKELGPDVSVLSPVEAAATSELLLLTVSDSAIPALVEELVAGARLNPGSVVVHCSGALASDVLSPLRGLGALGGAEEPVALASFHPLQTFPTVAAALVSLPGSHCFLEGDARAVEVLEALGGAIGAKCVRIETDAKVLYHAAAVMASNYLCALMDAALAAHEASGIDRETGMAALRPLVQSTLDNIATMGPEAALTGPIQRGDVLTIKLHLKALAEASPDLEALYRLLGQRTIALATKSGALDRTTQEELSQVIEDEAT
jgi:predicted short-subunit dehydrogenase-like oxidoreductase (DUF2520 family)